MKNILFITTLLCLGCLAGAFAQSGQSPVMQQSTSTVNSRPTSQPKPKLKKLNRRERMEMKQGLDTTLPKNRKQRRLRPDSLRRGGATRVDTV